MHALSPVLGTVSLSSDLAERRLGAPAVEGGNYVADARKSDNVNGLLKVSSQSYTHGVSSDAEGRYCG